MNTKRAIIIGATSGIGRHLAEQLLKAGYRVGLAGRNVDRVKELRDRYSDQVILKRIDVSLTDVARHSFEKLAEDIGGVDLVILSSGVGFPNPSFEEDVHTISVNIIGFTALATAALDLFQKQGYGQLVGISSVSALRGSALSPSFNASKAYVANYLEGQRRRHVVKGGNIIITDIKLGLVNTAMALREDPFWSIAPDKAAQLIFNAITQKKSVAYITRRWTMRGIYYKLFPWLVSRDH